MKFEDNIFLAMLDIFIILMQKINLLNHSPQLLIVVLIIILKKDLIWAKMSALKLCIKTNLEKLETMLKQLSTIFNLLWSNKSLLLLIEFLLLGIKVLDQFTDIQLNRLYNLKCSWCNRQNRKEILFQWSDIQGIYLK